MSCLLYVNKKAFFQILFLCFTENDNGISNKNRTSSLRMNHKVTIEKERNELIIHSGDNM